MRELDSTLDADQLIALLKEYPADPEDVLPSFKRASKEWAEIAAERAREHRLCTGRGGLHNK